MATSPKDIMQELNLRLVPKSHNEITHSLSSQEKNIYTLILAEAKLPDEIVSSSKFPIHEVLSTISALEIKGVIEKNRDGRYQVCVL